MERSLKRSWQNRFKNQVYYLLYERKIILIATWLPEGLDSVGMTTIRSLPERRGAIWTYTGMITGKLAEYAAKKYRSHRRIADHVIGEMHHTVQYASHQLNCLQMKPV